MYEVGQPIKTLWTCLQSKTLLRAVVAGTLLLFLLLGSRVVIFKLDPIKEQDGSSLALLTVWPLL